MATHKKIVSLLKDKEGGLSRDIHDSSSKKPSPCTYNGQTGWHTNKGVTWETFSSNASKLGYTASCSNFIKMPDSIWGKIFKTRFWDRFYLDDYKSQAVADIIVWSAWGSGSTGAFKSYQKFLKQEYGLNVSDRQQMKTAFNSLSKSKSSERKLFDQLVQWREDYYIGLSNPRFEKGWLNALARFREYGYSQLSSFGTFLNDYGLIVGTGLIAASVVTFIVIKSRKSS